MFGDNDNKQKRKKYTMWESAALARDLKVKYYLSNTKQVVATFLFDLVNRCFERVHNAN